MHTGAFSFEEAGRGASPSSPCLLSITITSFVSTPSSLGRVKWSLNLIRHNKVSVHRRLGSGSGVRPLTRNSHHHKGDCGSLCHRNVPTGRSGCRMKWEMVPRTSIELILSFLLSVKETTGRGAESTDIILQNCSPMKNQNIKV